MYFFRDSSLNNETAKREKEIRQEIASEISVLFTTVQAVTLRKFLNEGFRPDLVIIDEAAQCMECEAWPILFQVGVSCFKYENLKIILLQEFFLFILVGTC